MLSEREVVRQVRRVTVHRLRSWVERGWIRPERQGRAVTFTDADVARARLICELSDTMDIHEDAVPVILSLLDQIHGLRHEMKTLLAAIDALPPEARASVRARLAREVST